MSPVLDGGRYPTVRLYRDGVGVRFKVHRMVCRAFHGEPFEGAQAAHLDGTRDNCRADNLSWATRSENELHKRDHGTVRARLTKQAADILRARAASGEPVTAIAAEYEITDSHAYRIAAGERWK